ncbi:helix-turn-helix transcriptional regulator [Gordonia crocea]|uniref:Putative transcriptional regulatory protein n=1 Tax=Gordonia crocea TaxID=589162 RepID=A0A7I9UXZ0_9ACTN|nr:metalloregulator ArsR/SmtB family transcription factor [Gordonia crocea]GED98074.1 putative transcriptional regulatory protein [Gordonia crocea]
MTTSRRTRRADGAVGVGELVRPGGSTDGQTRQAVVELLGADGPLTAGDIADRLGISPAGVRRHLDALLATGDVETAQTGQGFGGGQRGRGRPAKWFQLTAAGRGKLRHAYDDLASAALRALRSAGGDDAIAAFAHERIERVTAEVVPAADADAVPDTIEQIASALTGAGYAANTRAVGSGVQICQHHCPVAHVAAEFPELCEAETQRFTELLGTHVQRLATIANGDCACTTHIPLTAPVTGAQPAPIEKEGS